MSVIVIALLASVILCYLWTSVSVRELLEESENHLAGGVPSLIGRSVGNAKAVLGETTLRLDAHDATDDATIAWQDPAPGAPSLVGGTVSVTAVTTQPDPWSPQ